MTVTRHAECLRRLAADLAEHFGLPWGAGGIDPCYDKASRVWTFRWEDGPTVQQVRRAARRAQPETAEGLRYERLLSARTYALGVLRLTLAAEPVEKDFRGRYFLPREIEEYFATTKNPAPKAGREATIVDNILKASVDYGRNFREASEKVCGYVELNGLAGHCTVWN